MGAMWVPVRWKLLDPGADQRPKPIWSPSNRRTWLAGALAGRAVAAETQLLTLSLSISMVIAASLTRKPLPADFAAPAFSRRLSATGLMAMTCDNDHDPVEAPGTLADVPATMSAGTTAARAVTSEDLFQGHREVLIVHAGETYRLRLTRNGKLILNK